MSRPVGRPSKLSTWIKRYIAEGATRISVVLDRDGKPVASSKVGEYRIEASTDPESLEALILEDLQSDALDRKRTTTYQIVAKRSGELPDGGRGEQVIAVRRETIKVERDDDDEDEAPPTYQGERGLISQLIRSNNDLLRDHRELVASIVLSSKERDDALMSIVKELSKQATEGYQARAALASSSKEQETQQMFLELENVKVQQQAQTIEKLASFLESDNVKLALMKFLAPGNES